MVTQGVLLLAVLCLSVGAVVWSIFFKSGDEPISFKDFVGLLPMVISLLGAAKEEKKRVQEKRRDRGVPPTRTRTQPPLIVAKPFRLMPSFNSGLYGGLIGGAIAGLIIGVAYYAEAREEVGWDRIPLIFVHASLTGTLGGAFILLTISWFRHLVIVRHYSVLFFNEVSGGIIGGAIGGILPGVLGGWLFWQLGGPFVKMPLLVAGSLLGAICIGLGVLLYDYEGRWSYILRALLVSTVIFAFVAMVGIIVLQSIEMQIITLFSDYGEVEGGAIVGLAVGILLGFQVGPTLWLYRLWGATTEPIRH